MSTICERETKPTTDATSQVSSSPSTTARTHAPMRAGSPSIAGCLRTRPGRGVRVGARAARPGLQARQPRRPRPTPSGRTGATARVPVRTGWRWCAVTSAPPSGPPSRPAHRRRRARRAHQLGGRAQRASAAGARERRRPGERVDRVRLPARRALHRAGHQASPSSRAAPEVLINASSAAAAAPESITSSARSTPAGNPSTTPAAISAPAALSATMSRAAPASTVEHPAHDRRVRGGVAADEIGRLRRGRGRRRPDRRRSGGPRRRAAPARSTRSWS